MQAREELLAGVRKDVASFLGHEDYLLLLSGSEALGCAMVASDIDISVVLPYVKEERRAANGHRLCNAMNSTTRYDFLTYNHAADPPLLSGRSRSGVEFDIALGYAGRRYNSVLSPSRINHLNLHEHTKVDTGNKRVNVLWGPYSAHKYQEYLRAEGISQGAFAQAVVYVRTWCKVRGLDNHRLGGFRPTFITTLVLIALPRLPAEALRPQLDHRVVIWAVCATFLELTARPALNYISIPCGRPADALAFQIATVQCAKVQAPLVFVPFAGFKPTMYKRSRITAAIDAADATCNNNTAHGISHGSKEYFRHRMGCDIHVLTKGRDIFVKRLDLSLPISLVPLLAESRILTAALRVYYPVEMTAEARASFVHDLLNTAKRAMYVADRKLSPPNQCYHHLAPTFFTTPWTGDAPWPLDCTNETPDMAFTFILGWYPITIYICIYTHTMCMCI